MRRSIFLACAVLSVACSASQVDVPDARVSVDGGGALDAGSPDDAGADAGALDAGEGDAGGPDASIAGDVGEPCASAADCVHPSSEEIPACLGPGTWPNGGGWIDGYCATACAPPPVVEEGAALEQRDCPARSLCAPLDETTGICLRGCESDADCRTDDGYYCRRNLGVDGAPTSNGVCMAAHCASRGCPGSAVCGC